MYNKICNNPRKNTDELRSIIISILKYEISAHEFFDSAANPLSKTQLCLQMSNRKKIGASLIDEIIIDKATGTRRRYKGSDETGWEETKTNEPEPIMIQEQAPFIDSYTEKDIIEETPNDTLLPRTTHEKDMIEETPTKTTNVIPLSLTTPDSDLTNLEAELQEASNIVQKVDQSHSLIGLSLAGTLLLSLILLYGYQYVNKVSSLTYRLQKKEDFLFSKISILNIFYYKQFIQYVDMNTIQLRIHLLDNHRFIHPLILITPSGSVRDAQSIKKALMIYADKNKNYLLPKKKSNLSRKKIHRNLSALS
jgi:hypothetical protein